MTTRRAATLCMRRTRTIRWASAWRQRLHQHLNHTGVSRTLAVTLHPHAHTDNYCCIRARAGSKTENIALPKALWLPSRFGTALRTVVKYSPRGFGHFSTTYSTVSSTNSKPLPLATATVLSDASGRDIAGKKMTDFVQEQLQRRSASIGIW